VLVVPGQFLPIVAVYWLRFVPCERWHLAWLLLGLVTAGSAIATRQYGWAVTVTGFNAAFNLYPVFHERYKRARLRQAAKAN
jgi:hypothetical protein